MIAVVRRKAEATGAGTICACVAPAEELTAREESFELVAMGNAFHRVRRERVAANVRRWLGPEGWLALLWGGTPWDGDAGWQRAVAETVRRWKAWPRTRSGSRRAMSGTGGTGRTG